MKKTVTLLSFIALSWAMSAQNVMTPEMLIQLGKLGALGISKDGKNIVYAVKKYNLKEDKSVL